MNNIYLILIMKFATALPFQYRTAKVDWYSKGLVDKRVKKNSIKNI